MMRIRTVVAVGSMALLGVVATGSSALAADGGHSPAKAGTAKAQPVNPAKAARCLARAGATVTRVKGGGYRIVIPGASVGHATRACKQYLPPGHVPSGTGTLVLQLGGAPTAAFGTGEKFVKCLAAHGAPPAATPGNSGLVTSEAPSGTAAAPGGPTTIVSGEVGSDDGGPSAVISADGAKVVKAQQACVSLAPNPGVVLQSAG
jgi:hypothetical protein